MLLGIVFHCDVCGKLLMSFGCCVDWTEQSIFKKKYPEGLCEICAKAVKDAREQVVYLKSLEKK
jgi:hypothetical protein